MNYVIIDIETTGLDKDHVSILEVGAILIEDCKVTKKFSSFAQYKGEIPLTIKRKTGIQESMVRDAPPIEAVLKDFKVFCEKVPVVAHYGFQFDYPVLERHGVRFTEKYDSLEFAYFVMPTNPHGHSTSAMSDYFGLPKIEHRALPDCEAEFAIIRHLQDEFSKRPKKKREGLIYAAQAVGWWWAHFLKGDAVKFEHASELVDKFKPYRKEDADQDELAVGTSPIDPKEVDDQFIPKGEGKDDYSEDRPEQRKMASIITRAFNESKHAIIEAGTGTGKSKAYLVPSLLFGLKNNFPVIISTYTRALQDQLFFKEIPHIRNTISPNLRVAMLKGKKNYVCVRNFDRFETDVLKTLTQRSLYEFNEEGAQFTTRLAYLLLLSWLVATDRGDWDEVPFSIEGRIPKYIEDEICNDDELCGAGSCEHYDEEICFLAKARLRARDADLVIINHAMTLSGIIPDEKVVVEAPVPGLEAPKQTFTHTLFPNEARFIVFDEAHHLEEAATSAWESRISQHELGKILQQLFGKNGAKYLVEQLASKGPKQASFAKEYDQLEREIKEIIGLLFDHNLPVLIPPTSDQCMLDPVSPAVKKTFLDSVRSLTEKFQSIAKIISSIQDDVVDERAHKILGIRANVLKRTIKSLREIAGNDKGFTRFLTRNSRNSKNIEIISAPISVAEYLNARLFENFSSVVMTSATLTVQRKFKFFGERCGVTKIPKDRLIGGTFSSSFDYKKQVKFFMPKGFSYKSSNPEAHLEKCGNFLESALIASGGGALVLCSSYKQVGELSERLELPLANQNIWLLTQIKGTSISSVIRDFKNDVNSVLIGTLSLWQGVDVPGESLRSLFIYKIPFKRRDDPIVRARCNQLEREGKDWYTSYYEPLAAIELKQGFGRLIRKSTDVGIAVCMDETLLNRPGLRESFPDGVKPQKTEPEVILKELAHLASLAATGKFNVEDFGRL